jgi:hypothetical protein
LTGGWVSVEKREESLFVDIVQYLMLRAFDR